MGLLVVDANDNLNPVCSPKENDVSTQKCHKQRKILGDVYFRRFILARSSVLRYFRSCLTKALPPMYRTRCPAAHYNVADVYCERPNLVPAVFENDCAYKIYL